MTKRFNRRWQRGLGVLLGAALVATLAAGPANIARALGLRAAATPAVGYLPSPHPIRVQSPHVLLYALTAVLTNDPITIVGGQSPPETLLLDFSYIRLDNLAITQNADGAALQLANGGAGALAAQVGSAGGRTHLWGVLHSLCMNLGDVISLASGFLGKLGSLLSPILGALSRLASAGPCPSITSLMPLLQHLLRLGVPLPNPISASNLDIDVYALDILPADGGQSVGLPLGSLLVSG